MQNFAHILFKGICTCKISSTLNVSLGSIKVDLFVGNQVCNHDYRDFHYESSQRVPWHPRLNQRKVLSWQQTPIYHVNPNPLTLLQAPVSSRIWQHICLKSLQEDWLKNKWTIRSQSDQQNNHGMANNFLTYSTTQPIKNNYFAERTFSRFVLG